MAVNVLVRMGQSHRQGGDDDEHEGGTPQLNAFRGGGRGGGLGQPAASGRGLPGWQLVVAPGSAMSADTLPAPILTVAAP